MSALQTDMFCAACGLSGPMKVEVALPRRPYQTHTLTQPWALLGRDPRATICVNDRSVSRRHAYFQVLGGRLYVVELSNREGLKLDGTRVSSACLGPGQRLSAGRCRLSVTVSPAAGSATDPSPADPLDLPEVEQAARSSFEIRQGGKRRTDWRINRPLVLIGGGERCRVRLRDGAISGQHCSLVATPSGVWVIDLLSRTGTRLNGQTVPVAQLKAGDVLGIGDFELHFRPVSVPTQPAIGPLLTHPAPTPVPRTPLCGPELVTALRGGGNSLTPVELEPDDREARLLKPLVAQMTAMQQLMFDQFSQTMAMLVQMLSAMHQEQAMLIREEMSQFQKATEELHRLQQQLREARPAAAPAPPPSLDRWQPGTWPGARQQSGVEQSADGAPLALPAPAAEGGAEDEDVHVWLQGRIEELESERQNSWQRLVGFFRGK